MSWSDPTLAETQAIFWRAITHPTGVAAFLEEADESTRALFHRTFAQTPQFSRTERMEVYAEAYYYRLEDVLREQFSVVSYLAGPERFHNLCTDYVLERPSVAPDIRQYGRRFPAFVRDHELSRKLPSLGEIADIDWAITDVLDAPDETQLTVEQLQGLSPEQWPSLRFRPMTTTRLLSSRWDFPALWRAMKNEESRPDAPPEEHDPPVFVLVWRQGLDVYHRPMRYPEAVALGALVRGEPFADVCARAAEAAPEVTPDTVASWLVRWLGSGLIAGLSSS